MAGLAAEAALLAREKALARQEVQELRGKVGAWGARSKGRGLRRGSGRVPAWRALAGAAQGSADASVVAGLWSAWAPVSRSPRGRNAEATRMGWQRPHGPPSTPLPPHPLTPAPRALPPPPKVSSLHEEVSRSAVLSREQLDEAARAKDELAALREAHSHLRARVAALEEDARKAQADAASARRGVAPLEGRLQ